jgi:hypothetical protein
MKMAGDDEIPKIYQVSGYTENHSLDMVNVKHSGEVMRVTNNCLGITFR